MKILVNELVNSWISGKIKLEYNDFKKLKGLYSAITDIEKREDIPYPHVRIVPYVKVLKHEFGIEAIVHANINFMVSGNVIKPIIDFSFPLLKYGNIKLWKAILTHELLHYYYLAIKYIESDIFSLSQYFVGTVIGKLIFDEVHAIEPNKILRDKYLIRLVTRDLKKMLTEKKFLNKVLSWIESKKPFIKVSAQDFYVKLSFSEFKKLYFPLVILNKLRKRDYIK